MTQDQYPTQQEKTKDFIIGFVGFLLLNVVVYLLATGLASIGLDRTHFADTVLWLALCALVPWVITLVPVFYFARRRMWIALGAIFALGCMVLCTVLGMCLVGSCFYILSGPWGPGY